MFWLLLWQKQLVPRRLPPLLLKTLEELQCATRVREVCATSTVRSATELVRTAVGEVHYKLLLRATGAEGCVLDPSCSLAKMKLVL